MKKEVTGQLVKELRERTGVGMGKCKEALERSGGDLEKAIEDLRKLGMASAVKKEGREANEGLIGVEETSKAIALVEINSETDFVCQNEKFKAFLKEVAACAAQEMPSSVEALNALKSKHDPSLTLDQYRALVVQSLGENIQIKRVLIFRKQENHSLASYSHMGGKIVTLVILAGAKGEEALAKDIAMHVAAESPEYLTPQEVPEEIKEREREIARSQLQNKPQNMIDKIVEGKLSAFYDQFCLVCQKYIKDNAISIGQLLERNSKEKGKHLTIEKFIRWQVGQS